MPGDYLWFSASKSCPVLSPRLKYHETWIQRWSTHKTEHFGVRRRCFICVRSRSYTLRHGEAVAFLFLDRLPFDINVLQIRLLYFGEQVRRKIKVNDREKQVRGGKREDGIGERRKDGGTKEVKGWYFLLPPRPTDRCYCSGVGPTKVLLLKQTAKCDRV